LLAGLPRMAILERCTVCCTRSLRPLPSFSRRVTPETDANGGIADWRPREPSCCSSVCTKAAVGEPYKIGLGSVPSLGYCIGMQYGDDEYLSCIGCPGALHRSCGPTHPRLTDRRPRRFRRSGVAGAGDGGTDSRCSRDAALECRMMTTSSSLAWYRVPQRPPIRDYVE
jgi:hypothetical protein